ncbi:hypothetical protein SNOG_15477 [Parastagonospora nodorum SN15]|uniref:Uncharacterized protein n=1 Tax=Phaeosphaeria nodorum (strain SN15 / ATCC MYA-4574 / FGSC 10173) TaxID=321614 RepID=Q0TYD4_PHANO|nr:hypothetical protein SNOG_15477 [Parastagonospora nodorum SN15]EAT77142.1 hypothetical protein SNOG_15477 [Parastagonospora nodorum SN15]
MARPIAHETCLKKCPAAWSGAAEALQSRTGTLRSFTSPNGVLGQMQVTGCHRGMQKLERPMGGLEYCRAPWKTAAQSYKTVADAGHGRPAVRQANKARGRTANPPESR